MLMNQTGNIGPIGTLVRNAGQISQNMTFRDTWQCDAIHNLTTPPHVESMVRKWKFLNGVIKHGNALDCTHEILYCNTTPLMRSIYVYES